MNALSIENLTRNYYKDKLTIAAVSGLNASFNEGTMTVIHGSSGSGKTTLLLMLGGMMQPSSGSVKFNGRDLYSMKGRELRHFRNRHVGFIFQKFYLLPYLTVRQNITLPLHIGENVRDNTELLHSLLERFRMSHRLNHLPGELSVGEQQRVALIRALIKDPALILADEPTGNLDPENLEIVSEALQEEAGKGRIVILVTHHASLFATGKTAFRLENGCFSDLR
ncbi:MAG: ABC transporter ATP-binding protein [Fibrobacteres bacterium]|nr:ABC transporter ATP-binding protein [Fibrobacterota bacterium]